MTSTAMKHSFTLNWVLDAPPAEVFRAWTDPDHLGWFYNPEQPDPGRADRAGPPYRRRRGDS